MFTISQANDIIAEQIVIIEKSFHALTDVADVKKLFRKLTMEYHPDRNMQAAPEDRAWNELRFKALNVVYQNRLRHFDGTTTVGDDKKERTYTYDPDVEQGLADQIAKTLAHPQLGQAIQAGSVELWLIGTWIWVKGDTKPHKESLGKDGLGYWWNGKQTAWCFNLEEGRRFYSGKGLEQLAEKYGAKKFTKDDDGKSGGKRGKSSGRYLSAA